VSASRRRAFDPSGRSRLTATVTDATGPETTTDRPATLFGPPAEVPTRVLVLGMVHQDGSLEAAELYDVAEACGQSVEQVRSCLRRLVAEGVFTRHGEGREARFDATPEALRSMSESLDRARLAFGQDAAGRGWDRGWHLVAFAIPEAKRASRDAFRDQLIHLGGAAIQNGLYVSPHPWEKAAREQAERLGVLEHTTFATTDDLEVGGVTDPRQLAAALWPLDRLGEKYAAFVERYSFVPELLEQRRREKRRLTEAEFLPGSLAFGIEYQQCFDDDPLLPPELLPRPWPGRDARELVLTCRRLGVLLREEHEKPKLFAPWDDLLLSFRS
jgi:phenylacetic acid degradation operon negative regulatory protein